jgi:23S rRNA pseudouridine2457 synthase
MTAAVGFPTLRLVRVAIGPVMLGDLAPGEARALAADEMKRLGVGWRRSSRGGSVP